MNNNLSFELIKVHLPFYKDVAFRIIRNKDVHIKYQDKSVSYVDNEELAAILEITRMICSHDKRKQVMPFDQKFRKYDSTLAIYECYYYDRECYIDIMLDILVHKDIDDIAYKLLCYDNMKWVEKIKMYRYAI